MSSHFLDILASFAIIKIEVIVVRFKDEMIDFLSSAPGKLLLILLGLCIICLIYLWSYL